MFSILNRALSWAMTSYGNKFCLRKRSRLIKGLDNMLYVEFMQLGIGIFCSFLLKAKKEMVDDDSVLCII